MSKIRDRLQRSPISVQETWTRVEGDLRPLLEEINDNFREFTIHDEHHALALEGILDWLVDPKAWDDFNDLEVLLLMVALWAHDVGMAASIDEAKRFAVERRLPEPSSSQFLPFLRDHHPSVGRRIVERIIREDLDPKIASLAHAAGVLVESHGASQIEGLLPFPVGHEGESVRPAFLAILLRLADVLHCTADRAPMQLFKARAISNTESVRHWRSHQATIGVGFDKGAGAIRIHIVASDVRSFAWAVTYRNVVQAELDYCAATAMKINLHSPNFRICSFKCIATSDTPFVGEVIGVAVDERAAITTLTGKNIYDDGSVAVRELLQNAMDACLLRKRPDPDVSARIDVFYDTPARTLVVQDNGIGMSLDDLKNSLFRSCTSGFRRHSDPTTLLAKFGIGFLSVFMIAERITIETRHINAGVTDGLTAVLSGVHDPVDIRRSEGLRVGTRIEVKLLSDATLEGRDIGKWLPDPRDHAGITAEVDGTPVPPLGTASGSARGLKFHRQNLTKSLPELQVRLRAVAVSDDDGQILPCGLSFQSKRDVDPRIDELPHVKCRYFVRGIPLVTRSGDRPPYHTRDGSEPLIERLFAPTDVDFLRPGELDLNLARNELVASVRNSETLGRAGTACLEMLVENYLFLREKTKDVSLLALRFIGEHWLTRLRASPSVQGAADSQGVLACYRTIWRDVRLRTYDCHTGRYGAATMQELEHEQKPIILFQLSRMEPLMSPGLDREKLGEVIATELGPDATVVDGFAHTQSVRLTVGDFLLSCANSHALLDTYAFRVAHAPLYVFETQGTKPFVPNHLMAVPVFGTEALFVGDQPRALGTGLIHGTNYPRLVINTRSKSYMATMEKMGGGVLPDLGQGDPMDWFRKQGFPESVLVRENLHASLVPNYPLAGPRILPSL